MLRLSPTAVIAALVMSYPLPPLNWLRAFEASARHLSFTQAAAELNLTQAGVSKQIKLLEHYLREKLFVRRARSLELTGSAAAYLPKVRDAFDRLSAGALEVFGDRRTAILTVRSNISFAVNWLAPRLADFRYKHPDKPIRLLSSVWSTGDQDERANDHVDLEIQYGFSGWTTHQVDRLTTESLFPLCSPDFAQQHRLKSPADLRDHTLISVLGYEEGWDAWLKATGVDGKQMVRSQQVDTSLLAFELAANSFGLALGRSSLANKEIHSGRLVRPFDLRVEVREGFFLISPAPEFAHPHAAAFRKWLLEESTKMT